MDISSDTTAHNYDSVDSGNFLSYDDTIPYEEQIPRPKEHAAAASLQGRIGTARVYLMSDTLVARLGKRKLGDEDVANTDGSLELDRDISHRANALLLQGPPIAHLATARIFAYAKHFHLQPMCLEWVDDATCVLVFQSKALARDAYVALQRSAAEEPDADNFVGAHSIPVALWPPEERIGASLGKGHGLKGAIRMRWAVEGDVKQRGSRDKSEFYRKHGAMAGKEVYGGEGVPPTAKRRKQLDGEPGTDSPPLMDAASQKAQLDAELEQFLAEGNSEESARLRSSKMRSDYIAPDGRTLLERTSAPGLISRITSPLPRRAKEGHGVNGNVSSENLSSRISTDRWGPSYRAGSRRGERRPHRGAEPSKKRVTLEELDAEMDAFWKEQS